MNTLNRILALSALIIASTLFCASAVAEIYEPPGGWPSYGLTSLDHGKYYTWGIDITWDPLVEQVESATLSFDHLRNWNDSDNDLWIHLIDNAPLGITTGNDWGGGGDHFLGQGILLEHYVNLPSTGEDKTIAFDAAAIAALNTYAADGRIAIALDPDCHFCDCGVQLEVQVGAIPEPGVLLIASIGAGLIALLRKAKKA
jgi:hypothetical protein